MNVAIFIIAILRQIYFVWFNFEMHDPLAVLWYRISWFQNLVWRHKTKQAILLPKCDNLTFYIDLKLDWGSSA